MQGAGWAPAPTMGEADAEAAQSCWAGERPPYWRLARLQAAPALSCPEMFELAACILEMSFLKLTGILFLGNKHVLTQTPPSSAQRPLLLGPPRQCLHSAARRMLLSKREWSNPLLCPSDGPSAKVLLPGSSCSENTDSYRPGARSHWALMRRQTSA